MSDYRANHSNNVAANFKADTIMVPPNADTYIYAKQKHPGCKKGARPIRSTPTYVRPKSLISAEAKKSSIKDVE